jgi:hypothetical protein
MVVVRLPESGQQRWAYDVLAIRHPKWLIAVAPRMDRLRLFWTVSYQVYSPNPSHFVDEEGDEILDRDLSMPGSHGRYLKGFVSGDSRRLSGAYSPRGSKYSDRN